MSQRIHQGSASSGTLLRSVYLRYGSNGPLNGSYQDRNLRVEAQRVVYHDDGDRWTETEWSDFDGLGHFRSEKRSSNFPGSVNRTSITTYNPGGGTLEIDPDTSLPEAGNTFSVPAASAAWVIQRFDKRRVLKDGLETRAEYCFRANGLLRAQRVLAQETHSPNDLLSVYAHTDGFLTRELSHGGDTAVNLPLGYTDLCDASLPPASEAEFRTDHSWSHGSLATSHAIDPCDSGSVLRLVERTIDPATGLVASARDPADVSMSFEFDALGRLTAERPQFDAWTRYSYQLPSLDAPTDEPQVTVEQCDKASLDSCTALTFSRHTYDGFGRRILEERTLPEIDGVATHERTHTYNALGWKLSESVWSSTGNTNATAFLGHDPFGRPSTVTLPDGTSTTFAYRGDRIVTRGATVALTAAAGGGEPPIFTTETRDQHGRLVAVCEGQSEDGMGVCDEVGAVETTYSYDRNDQLVKVCSARSGSTCTQQRLFDVDGRGLRTAESHPEVGPSGNGWTYFFYDARGNVIEKNIDGTSDFDLAYAYDRAGRLVGVDQVKDGVFRPLKELSYARDNLSSEKRAGKLVLAKRYNYRDFVSPLGPYTEPLTLTVSQRYRYDTSAGRVAERQTRFRLNATTYAFTTQFSWDQLGNPYSIDYPRCLHSDCTGEDPPRTLEHTYEEGYLRTIPNIADKLSYQAGGMLGRVRHANGIVHSYAIDPSGMARPRQVKTELAGVGSWESGQYDFDGSGNITEIGTRSYRYDLLNRLGSGEAENGMAQTVAYDPVGNITSLVTNSVTQSTTTSTATNRLTDQGATYDAGGNLTSITLGGQQQVFEYDALNLMRSMETSSDLARAFVYDANDERIATLECVPPNTCATNVARDTWTIRDLSGKVLRTYEHQWEGNTWTWERDYVYRDGVPMASIEPDGAGGETTHHLHVDHLGSIREITDATGSRVAYHSYYPFGGEALSTGSDEVKLKFTGHERDESGGVALDYMHARYCSPVTGRFLGVDPARSTRPGLPQSWNRYSYALGNPIRYVDPDGESARSGIRLLWNRASHIWNRHVRKAAPAHKSQYKTNDMEHVKKLGEKTVRRPDKVDIQSHDRRTVWQREFNKDIGSDGQRVNVVVTERVAENTERVVTSFPAKSFKEILGLIPVVGAYFLAEDAAAAGAEALEEVVNESEIAARQRDLEALVADPEF